MEKRLIKSGLYLVVNPSMDAKILLSKLELALKENIAAVQIWDNFAECKNIDSLIKDIIVLCHKQNTPVLINNQWEYLMQLELDGVHFDELPHHLKEIKQNLDKDFIVGLTCNNELSDVEWAESNQLDYISFCSIFPSSTSNSCELVEFETIQKARKITSIPIFLAGGIKSGNMKKLMKVPYDGVAVASGIMNAVQPTEVINEYLNELKKKE